MKNLSGESGIIRLLPLFIVVAAVGILSFLLITSTLPLSGLLGLLNPKPNSHAAISGPLGTPIPITGPISTIVKLNSLTPSSGNTESNVILSGSKFGSVPGNVIFVTGAGTQWETAWVVSLISWNDQNIQVVVPWLLAGNQVVQVYVHSVSSGDSNVLPYQILLGQPRIDLISPNWMLPGAILTLNGSGYGLSAGKVNFYEIYPTIAGTDQIISWSDTQIQIRIPQTLKQATEYGIEVVSAGPTHSSFKYYTLGPAPTTPIQGDIDNNGKVDIFDYNILVGNFGKIGSAIQGDIDSSGKVDIFDYNILVTNFGKIG